MLDNWENCYRGGWSGMIVPEAFSHPAKVSFSLAERIYQHMEEEGWIHPGMTVTDPFAGIGGCAFHAMIHGLNWVGIELEPRFCALAEQNIALWNKRYAGKMPRWGSARIINGDSRNLAAILQGQAEASVSSPPFSDSLETKDENFVRKAAVDALSGKTKGHGSSQEYLDRAGTWAGYGSTPGNLGNMKSTPAGLADAMVSSPPYAETPIAGYDGSMGDQWRETGKTPRQRSGGKLLNEQYGGTSPGQLGAMRATESGLDAAVSSPPFENGQPLANPANTYKVFEHIGSVQLGQDGYGKTDGNIGNSTGSDFWAASRTIVDQLYRVLAPGAHCVWVLKAFVKAGKIVPFPEQWQAMCEAAGFETVHVHHAMLVKTKGTQIDMDGNSHTKTIARKSFFRRLAESKGSPRIDYEIILCMVKL